MAILGQYYNQLPAMTEQEVIEVGVTHLIEQGSWCGTYDTEEDTWRCMYSDGAGGYCGAAPFIDPTLDLSIYNANVAYSYIVEEGVAHEEHTELITSLQDFHDTVAPEDWASCAKSHFSKYDIDWSFLEELTKT